MSSTTIAPDPLETLRQVNEILRSALVRLRPGQRHCSTIVPQDFSDLLSHILLARECRRPQFPRQANPALENESLEYRCNLEKLKDFLPELHGHLLAEKSRLESARDHLSATAAWAQASKETL